MTKPRLQREDAGHKPASATRPPSLGFLLQCPLQGCGGPGGSSMEPTWPGASKTLRKGRLPPPEASRAILGDLGVVRGLSRRPARESKTGGPAPKASQGQAGEAKEGNRPSVKPTWREAWKLPPFPSHSTNTTRKQRIRPAVNARTLRQALGRAESAHPHSAQPPAAAREGDQPLSR